MDFKIKIFKQEDKIDFLNLLHSADAEFVSYSKEIMKMILERDDGKIISAVEQNHAVEIFGDGSLAGIGFMDKNFSLAFLLVDKTKHNHNVDAFVFDMLSQGAAASQTSISYVYANPAYQEFFRERGFVEVARNEIVDKDEIRFTVLMEQSGEF
jgi:N-acetylglutamate synthase-like GNAT family acetyltransferase